VENRWSGWWRGRRAVFVSGTGGDTRRYRCDYQAEQLRLAGAATEVVAFENGIQGVIDGLADTHCLVVHRLAWDEQVEALLAAARARAVPTVFDTDDLIFEADAAGDVAWFIDMDESERRLSFERQRQTLLECTAVTVTTRPLADRAHLLSRRVAVVPNAVGAEMTGEAEAALAAREGVPGSPETTIAYLSGTPTHDRDFAEAAEAVHATLAERPSARLLVVGYLQLDRRFDEVSAQIDRLPFQPRQRLPGILARADVNIAPLEPGNPFAEAKSCLKYFEAGLVATPTIASPVSDFARAIGDGDTGLLASGPAAWRRALERLLDDPAERLEIGRRARADVLARHTAAASWPALARTFALLATASAAEMRLYNRGRSRAAPAVRRP
jgi:glycosyltransferase involved in cell wall biosynthesis